MNKTMGVQTEKVLNWKTVTDCISATDIALRFIFRSVGGIRVSMYNAVKLDDIKTLVDFMKDFRQQNQKQ